MLTWLMWSHCAPADDIIVVSEIGEQWSPQTAPARHAEIPITLRVDVGSFVNRYVTIGIKIPKVPHDVPVENDNTQATKKMIAGKKFCRDAAALLIKSAT